MKTIRKDKKNNRKIKGKVLIEAQGIGKRYRSGTQIFDVLQKVNLVIREGDFIALLGPSGSGKTTLLRCLCGAEKNTGGDIYIAGEHLDTMKEDERTKLRGELMGFLFGTINVLPVLTILDNVQVMHQLQHTTRDSRKRTEEALAEVGIIDGYSRKPDELDNLDKQKVALARAIVHRPSILWADEPTAMLRSSQAAEFIDLLKYICSKHRIACIIATHNPNVAAKTSRIFRLESGMIV